MADRMNIIMVGLRLEGATFFAANIRANMLVAVAEFLRSRQLFGGWKVGACHRE